MSLGATTVAGAQGGDLGPKGSGEALQRKAVSARAFLENKGQWDSQALFLGRAPGANVWVTRQGFKFDYYRKFSEAAANPATSGHVVGLEFLGANKNRSIRAVGKTDSTTDFLSGSATGRGVSGYGKVYQSDLYRGVDLVTYYDGANPRYDFIVKPAANPNQIRFSLKGTNKVSVDANGDLVFATSLGDRKLAGLVAYQNVGGARKTVSAKFTVDGNREIKFSLGDYDKTRELVIDPLIYGSYYGGDGGLDEVRAVVSDGKGGVYLTGATRSPRFPSIYGPYGFAAFGGWDAFLTKFQEDAYSHDYSAIFGGSRDDFGNKIAIDQFGSVWVAGTTKSTNFPVGLSQPKADDDGVSDLFLIRFKQGGPELLTPFEADGSGKSVTQGIILKGSGREQIAGLAILPRETADPAQPARIYVGGTTAAGLEEIPGFDPAFGTGFFLTLDYRFNATTKAGSLTVVPATSQYLKESAAALTGMAINSAGEIYVSGTLNASGSSDTATDPNPVFKTTPGIFEGGNLQRSTDLFVRKYGKNGDIVWSGLVGGNAEEQSAGVLRRRYFINGIREVETFGTSIAVDPQGNAYIYGRTASFNYPRTRGVYGEIFDGNAWFVVVTKISNDGKQLLYSTNLRATGGLIEPMGIAVDSRGTAYVTGIVGNIDDFPTPTTPPDPYQPTGIVDGSTGSIPTTPDALKSAFTFPATSNLTARDAYVLALSPSATSLVYGSYIGGLLDEYIYSPYTDRFGDVYLVGVCEQKRYFNRISSTGTLTEYLNLDGGLTAGSITPLAFKSSLDQTAFLYTQYEYSIQDPVRLPIDPVINLQSVQDGFILKMRLGLPTVSNLVIAPDTVPGGDSTGGSNPTSVTGQVTLSQAAPPGGLNLTLRIIAGTSAASFNRTGTALEQPIFIPQGATTANFVVYTRQVTSNTQVQVRADYEGNFLVSSFVVVPWLQQLSVSPSSAIGGNTLTGRITLYQNVTGDTPVRVSAANASDPVIQPITVIVPAGTATTTFNVETKGVNERTNFKLNALLLSAVRTADVTLDPASLAEIVLSTETVADGTRLKGVLKLNGKAGGTTGEPGIKADMAVTPDAAGRYRVKPKRVEVLPQTSQSEFEIVVPFENDEVTRTVTATRVGKPGEMVSANFTVKSIAIQELLLTPDTTTGGQEVKLSVSLTQPAAQGGRTVYLWATDSNGAASSNVTMPESISFAQGEQLKEITIKTAQVLGDRTVNITASRAAKSVTDPALKDPSAKTKSLNIQAVTITGLTFTPASVAGGYDTQVKLTLSAPAPAGGQLIYLKREDPVNPASPAIILPSTVRVPEGATEFEFAAKTRQVLKTVIVKVTASRVNRAVNTGAGEDPAIEKVANVTVRANLVRSIVFSSNPVVGGFTVDTTVTMSEPAPVGGQLLYVSSDNTAATVPATVTVPEGSTTAQFTINTKVQVELQRATIRVSRIKGALPANADPAVARTAVLQIRPHTIGSVIIDAPKSVYGGDAIMAKVTLNQMPPPSGVKVYLWSSAAKYAKPAVSSVVVTDTDPTDGYSATFEIRSSVVTQAQTARIYASRVYGDTATAKSDVVTVKPHAITGILPVDPTTSTIQGGENGTFKVVLDHPAPASGIPVYLKSSVPSTLTVPSMVTVPAGADEVQFTVGAAIIPKDRVVKITASRLNTFPIPSPLTKETLVTVKGVGIAISLNPSAVFGGSANPSSVGTVTLSNPVTTDQIVTLTSDNGAAQVPSAVRVVAGSSTATFAIRTIAVSSATSANITASFNGRSASADLTINPVQVATTGLSFNPSTVKETQSTTGTVTLNAPAPAGGLTVMLVSSQPELVTVPTSVTIPAGGTSATFTASARRIGSSTQATVTASLNGSSASATITVVR